MLVTGARELARTSCFNTCPRRPEPFTSAAASRSRREASAPQARAACRCRSPLRAGFGSRSSVFGSVGAGLGAQSRLLTMAATSRAARLSVAASAVWPWRAWTRLGASAIEPSRAPMATVSPDLTAISDSTPEAGAGTSTVTLSVSSSTRGSSAETWSPACLNHWPTVASLMLSPRLGTRISVAMAVVSFGCPL